VNQNLTLDRIEKVQYYIKIKIHKTIILRFWDKNDVKLFICVKLIPYIYIYIYIYICIYIITISQYDYNYNSYESIYKTINGIKTNGLE